MTNATPDSRREWRFVERFDTFQADPELMAKVSNTRSKRHPLKQRRTRNPGKHRHRSGSRATFEKPDQTVLSRSPKGTKVSKVAPGEIPPMRSPLAERRMAAAPVSPKQQRFLHSLANKLDIDMPIVTNSLEASDAIAKLVQLQASKDDED